MYHNHPPSLDTNPLNTAAGLKAAIPTAIRARRCIGWPNICAAPAAACKPVKR